jgi:hypothetical protein
VLHIAIKSPRPFFSLSPLWGEGRGEGFEDLEHDGKKNRRGEQD